MPHVNKNPFSLHPPSPLPLQQRQKELTLRRRRSRLQQEEARGTLKRGGDSLSGEGGEFDELITVLRSGDFFDTHRRRRSRPDSSVSSLNSRLLETSRDRTSSDRESTPLSPHANHAKS